MYLYDEISGYLYLSTISKLRPNILRLGTLYVYFIVFLAFSCTSFIHVTYNKNNPYV